MRKLTLLIFSVMALFAAGWLVSADSGNSKNSPLDPRAAATVTINFDGLQALAFGDPSRVSVGILSAPEHRPTIKITRINGTERTVVAELTPEQLHGTLEIIKESGAESISRYYGESIADANDFRNTVDLEGDLFNRELHLNESQFWGKIQIYGGTYYADKLSEQSVRFVAANNPNKILPFNRRIADPAAKLNLAAGDALLIKGAEKPIRLAAQPNVSYQIDITNLPKPELASNDHFVHYYSIINDRLPTYLPVMVQKAALRPAPAYCCSVVFTRSRIK